MSPAHDLEANLAELHGRIHRGAYRAQPSRRVYIPKPDGRQRPLGIAALEDKVVQRAIGEVLNAIYEEDFLDVSYGFRPGRGQHDALDARAVGIGSRRVNWIVDADNEGVIRQTRNRFAVLDRRGDGNGTASLAEFTQFGNFVIQLYDENGNKDGRMSRQEFIDSVTPVAP